MPLKIPPFTPVPIQPTSAEPFSTFVQQTPLAQTPLSGTELVPIIQGGTSKHTPQSVIAPLFAHRILVAANINFYVNNLTGSDSNNGLSLASPFATLQHAWDNLTANYDLGGLVAAQINLAASGTPYTLNAFLTSVLGGAQVNIIGAGSATTKINDTLIQTFPMCDINFGSVTLADGGSGDCIQLYSITTRIGFIDADVILAGNNSFAHILVDGNGAFFGFENNFKVSGNATYIFFIASFSASFIANCIVTFTGTPVVTQVFNVSSFSQFNSSGATYSGAITGSKFTITQQSLISSDVTLPGSTAGTLDFTSSLNGNQGVTKISGLPTTTNLPSDGICNLFKDTSGGGVYLAYNDGGTIKKVALT